MPTYDYQCDACDHKFELYQGINDDKKKKCPECGKLKLRRLIGTGSAIIFKGSGFYKTDYRSDSFNKAKAADTPSEGKSTDSKGSESKSSETKASQSQKGESKSSDGKSGTAKKSSGGSSSKSE